MAGNFDVYLYLDPADNKVKATPGVVIETRTAVVKFRNLTDSTVNLTFPPGLLKGYPNGTTKAIVKTANVQIDDNAAAGFYPYQGVSMGPKGKRRKVYGGSDPGMIVDA